MSTASNPQSRDHEDNPSSDKKVAIKGLSRRTANTLTPKTAGTPSSAKSKTPTTLTPNVKHTSRTPRTPKTPTIPEKKSPRTPNMSRQSSTERLVKKEEELFLIPPDKQHRITKNIEQSFLTFSSPGTTNFLVCDKQMKMLILAECNDQCTV
jgi:hypothetical protein